MKIAFLKLFLIVFILLCFTFKFSRKSSPLKCINQNTLSPPSVIGDRFLKESFISQIEDLYNKGTHIHSKKMLNLISSIKSFCDNINRENLYYEIIREMFVRKMFDNNFREKLVASDELNNRLQKIYNYLGGIENTKNMINYFSNTDNTRQTPNVIPKTIILCTSDEITKPIHAARLAIRGRQELSKQSNDNIPVIVAITAGIGWGTPGLLVQTKTAYSSCIRVSRNNVFRFKHTGKELPTRLGRTFEEALIQICNESTTEADIMTEVIIDELLRAGFSKSDICILEKDLIIARKDDNTIDPANSVFTPKVMEFDGFETNPRQAKFVLMTEKHSKDTGTNIIYTAQFFKAAFKAGLIDRTFFDTDYLIHQSIIARRAEATLLRGFEWFANSGPHSHNFWLYHGLNEDVIRILRENEGNVPKYNTVISPPLVRSFEGMSAFEKLHTIRRMFCELKNFVGGAPKYFRRPSPDRIEVYIRDLFGNSRIRAIRSIELLIHMCDESLLIENRLHAESNLNHIQTALDLIHAFPQSQIVENIFFRALPRFYAMSKNLNKDISSLKAFKKMTHSL